MKPLTRKEQFFNYILGKSAFKPKPMTREEKILDEFKPTMVVNILKTSGQNTFTSDKSFAEILAHLDDGGDIICWYKESANGAPCRAQIRFYNTWVIHFTIIDIVPDLEGGSLENCTLKSLSMSSAGANYYTSRSIAFGS